VLSLLPARERQHSVRYTCCSRDLHKEWLRVCEGWAHAHCSLWLVRTTSCTGRAELVTTAVTHVIRSGVFDPGFALRASSMILATQC
jgi:hypothetical protein